MADLPPGFVYHADVVTEAEERALLEGLAALAFGDVRMRGQVARRRTVQFGWTYGYETWRVEPGPPIPAFLLPLRERVAPLAGVGAAALAEVLVTHYPPGAGIGWHRDAPEFGVVVGVSLLGACRFRFQQGFGAARRTRAVDLAPRSAYVLDGAARWEWQHAIPPGKGREAGRYSVTFRTVQGERAGASPERGAPRDFGPHGRRDVRTLTGRGPEGPEEASWQQRADRDEGEGAAAAAARGP